MTTRRAPFNKIGYSKSASSTHFRSFSDMISQSEGNRPRAASVQFRQIWTSRPNNSDAEQGILLTHHFRAQPAELSGIVKGNLGYLQPQLPRRRNSSVDMHLLSLIHIS